MRAASDHSVRAHTFLLPALAFAAALAALVRMRWPLARFEVHDRSMEPAYRPGDRVLVWRLAYAQRAPRPGDVLVLHDPEGVVPYLIKRVATPPEKAPGGIYVLGDDPAQSRDSRAFGLLDRRSIVGKVVLKY